jgi:excisionase family DNA binding protein
MGMTAEGGSGLLTVPEVATFLRLKVSTVRAWVLKRRIPYVKLGGRVFVRKMDALELIDKSVVPAKVASF